MSAVGLAHVATASFLASRAAPAGGFAIALAGGVALARAAQRHGMREGYGASLGAMLQTVAIMGPARFGVPLTQALSAPLVGRLQERGAGASLQTLVVAVVRALQNAAGLAFYVFVILGADAYERSYQELFGWLPFGVVAATILSALAWAVFASAVQVLVYRRGLRRWDASGRRAPSPRGTPSADPGPVAGRFDPRVVSGAAAVAFGLLLASTAWPLLGAVAAWLAVAWLSARADRSVVRSGLVLAALLAGGTLVFGLIGGLGVELTLRRTIRAALLVLVATWLRAAAGREGMREVFRRGLHRLRRLPAAREASRMLEGLGSTSALTESGRALVEDLRPVRRRPRPLVDAVLAWVAREAGHHRAPPPGAGPSLGVSPSDAVLVAGVLVAGLALLAT